MQLKIAKSYAIGFLIFVFGLLYNSAQSQSQFDTYKIAGISVEGNNYSDAETIIALSGLRVGSEFAIPYDDNIKNAIKNLWDRKQFKSIDIVVDKITPLGVFLNIIVKENSRMGNVIIENNKELSEKQIKNGIGKIKGDIISGYDVYLIKQSIKKLYENEGLAFAKVFIDMLPSDTTIYEDLKIWVEEGTEFYVQEINFTGNNSFDNSDLMSEFNDTKTKQWFQFWRSSKFDRKKYKEDLKLLTAFYKRKGFIDISIIKDSIFYDDANRKVYLNIDISEGNKIHIRNIIFQGNTVYPSDVLLSRLEFAKGDDYDVERFDMNLRGNRELTDASSLYYNTGYLTANFDKKEVRVSDDSVDIIVNVYENERAKIRRVDITGNTKTKDKVIRRELFTRPGDYFDRSAIMRSIQQLGVLNYFNPEALQPQVLPVPGDNTSVDIVYKVEERSTDTFNASVGFAGSFGLTGAIGFTFNNFSIAEPLSGGGGQMFNLNWEFGQASRFQSFSVGFSEPWLNDEPITMGFNVFDTRLRFSGLDQKRTGVSLNLGKRLKWPDDYFRGDLSLRIQQNDIGGNPGSFYRAGLNTEYTIGTSISRTSIDNMFFATQGSRFNFSNNWAMGAIGIGTTDFLKTEVLLEFYNPIAQIQDQNRLVLFLSSRFGYINGFASDTAMSPIELYYMGGNGLGGFNVTPLRGYPDRQIGPSTGGKLLSRYIAELRFALSLNPMPIYFYGFAEAGNVWDNFRESEPFNLKRSAGLGIQLLLNPIGIIGFSYGYGFDPIGLSDVPSGWRFLFHLGQQ